MKLQTTLTMAALTVGLCVSSAHAALIIDITESGGNTTATFSGSFNLNATLGYQFTNASGSFMAPNSGGFGYIAIGGITDDVYDLNTAPAAYGPGGFSFLSWTSVVGTVANFYANPAIGLPTGYMSSAPINGSAVAVGDTFASLGLVSGTSFMTTFSNGPISDTVTFNVVPTSVIPEPSTYIAGAGLISLAGFVLIRARRQKAAASV